MPFFTSAELHPYFRKHPGARNRYVGLVGCGKAKLPYPAMAKDIYTGGYTKMSIGWAELNCSTFFILSAKYGLLDPFRVIKPYNVRLTDYDEDEVTGWGNMVQEQLFDFGIAGRVVVVLAGMDYTDAVKYPGENDVLELCRNMKMGDRLRWMKKHPVLTDKVLEEVRKRNAVKR